MRNQKKDIALPPFSPSLRTLMSSTLQPLRVPAPRPRPAPGPLPASNTPGAFTKIHACSGTSVFHYQRREKRPPLQLGSIPAPGLLTPCLVRDTLAMMCHALELPHALFQDATCVPCSLRADTDTSGLNSCWILREASLSSRVIRCLLSPPSPPHVRC